MVDHYEGLRDHSYPVLVKAIKRGQYIPPERLGEALLRNRGKPIPEELLVYMAGTLTGIIKKPLGRKPPNSIAFFQEQLTITLYPRFLEWAQQRKSRPTPKRRRRSLKSACWAMPAHELAARLTSHYLMRRRFPLQDWRHIQNVVSSWKKKADSSE